MSVKDRSVQERVLRENPKSEISVYFGVPLSEFNREELMALTVEMSKRVPAIKYDTF